MSSRSAAGVMTASSGSPPQSGHAPRVQPDRSIRAMIASAARVKKGRIACCSSGPSSATSGGAAGAPVVKGVAPIAPQVLATEKRIEIYLDRQILLAFEWGELVYAARVATGRRGFESPTGTFHTFHKRPTYHMFGGADEFSIFDLPGVPWDTYITEGGVAIHGTYWHNDFGTPHSHGCINMAPADARWIFRWTQPTVPFDERLALFPGQGTHVWIFQS